MLTHLSKYLLALLVNFALFIIIPLLHSLFGMLYEPHVGPGRQREVVTEIIQPKKEERKTPRSRIRQVQSSTQRAVSDDFAMRFTPDLDVAGEGGVQMAAQDLEAEIFEEGETDEDLVPVHIPPIPYPERARDLGIEGVLLVELVVGRDGKVESVEVVRSPHPSISSAARKAVAHWRFKPAKNKGIAVKVRARKEIEFKLD